MSSKVVTVLAWIEKSKMQRAKVIQYSQCTDVQHVCNLLIRNKQVRCISFVIVLTISSMAKLCRFD